MTTVSVTIMPRCLLVGEWLKAWLEDWHEEKGALERVPLVIKPTIEATLANVFPRPTSLVSIATSALIAQRFQIIRRKGARRDTLTPLTDELKSRPSKSFTAASSFSVYGHEGESTR